MGVPDKNGAPSFLWACGLFMKLIVRIIVGKVVVVRYRDD